MQLIKVGLCAFGMSGRVFHAPFLSQHPGFTISGIVERHGNDSQNLYPEATLYRSVERLVESECDIIIINTPVQTHYEYCKLAIEKGKNVIVEKPFTVNAAQADELVALAEEKGVFLSVFQNRRYDRDYLQVKNIIEKRILGEIKEAEIRFDRYRTTASGKKHKEDPLLPASGALHDLGAHLIDQGVQLLGVPHQVFADVFSMKGPETANDYFEILCYYENGMRLRVKSSVFVKEDHFAYKIHGSNGSFLQERSDSQEAELVGGVVPLYTQKWLKDLVKPDGILRYKDLNDREVREELWSSPGSYMYYFQAIYEHVVFGHALPSPGKEVVVVMEIIDAAIKSAREGRIIGL